MIRACPKWIERLTVQDNTGLEELSQAQRERLAHIDFTLLFKGEAGRSYLTERFSVAPSVATQDFARYKSVGPNNVMYDEKAQSAFEDERIPAVV